MIRLIVCLLLLLVPHNSFALTFYVDAIGVDSAFTDEALNCATPVDTDYDLTTRQCGSGAETVYATIQAAVTATDGKDEVYIRNGTYSEIDIDVPDVGGDAWTAGNFSTLASYVGEWAIIDGTGLNPAGDEWSTSIIGTLTNYTPSSMNEATHYWLFERLELTGGRSGITIKPAPCKFRYLYIHDNGRDLGDSIMGGMITVNSQDSIFEYNAIIDNDKPTSPVGQNNASILFDADYRDTTGAGLTFDTTLGTQRNIVRYNYLYGTSSGITHKNQQRFGVNARDPDISTGDMLSYLAYGDDVHHNIILAAADYAMTANQDYQQVHNNIFDKRISLHHYHEYPITYGYVAYNNTSRTAGGSSGGCINYWSAINENGTTGTAYDNFYDDGANTTAHPWAWMYNNICTGPTSSAQEAVSLMWLGDTPTNLSPIDWDATDLVIDRNYIHGVTNADQFYVGNVTAGQSQGDCLYKLMTVSEFNSCQDTWRSTSGTANYDTSAVNLWVGGSGADQYRVQSDHTIQDTTTISNGGIGTAHPYLAGVTIPSYIGAANPSDDDWVAGVLALDATYLTSAVAGSDPTWIEGTPAAGGGSGSTAAGSGNISAGSGSFQ